MAPRAAWVLELVVGAIPARGRRLDKLLVAEPVNAPAPSGAPLAEASS